MKNTGRHIAFAFLQVHCAMFCWLGSTTYESTAESSLGQACPSFPHQVFSLRQTQTKPVGCSDKSETIQNHDFASFGQIGVSLAGAEFGNQRPEFSNENSGKIEVDYIFPDENTIQFFASHSVDFFRLPILWERIQPQPNQRLNPFYLNRIIKFCDQSQRYGIKVVVDLHNYGRYRLHDGDQPQTFVVDQVVGTKTPISRANLADLWRRLASKLANHSTVIGYGLMNEPHTMGNSNWKTISQTAVDAIRSVDKTTHLLIAGEHWSSAERFISANGPRAWIDDPSHRVIYEAHIYFDHDSSGRYRLSFESELKKDPRTSKRGQNRLQPFLNWCKANDAKGIIGEVGCPANVNWKPLLERTTTLCLEKNVPVCYWAAGAWWGDYPLSVQPNGNHTLRQTNDQVALQWRWLVSAKQKTHLPLTTGPRLSQERDR